MKKSSRLLSLIAALILTFLSHSSHAEDASFPSKEYETPVHKSMTSLCSGSDLSTTGDEIVWTNFTSPLPTDRLIAVYNTKLEEAGFKAEGGGADWSISVGGARHLSIVSVKDYRAHGPCDKKPSQETRSVVEISAFYKRASRSEEPRRGVSLQGSRRE